MVTSATLKLEGGASLAAERMGGQVIVRLVTAQGAYIPVRAEPNPFDNLARLCLESGGQFVSRGTSGGGPDQLRLIREPGMGSIVVTDAFGLSFGSVNQSKFVAFLAQLEGTGAVEGDI